MKLVLQDIVLKEVHNAQSMNNKAADEAYDQLVKALKFAVSGCKNKKKSDSTFHSDAAQFSVQIDATAVRHAKDAVVMFNNKVEKAWQLRSTATYNAIQENITGES